GSRYVRNLYLLFFSSRRRHTRSKRDWSSDVCSSDLSHRALGGFAQEFMDRLAAVGGAIGHFPCPVHNSISPVSPDMVKIVAVQRSEERRVGEEEGRRWEGGLDKGHKDHGR